MDAFKLRVVDLQKVLHQESGKYFLDVAIEIVKVSGESEEVVASQKHGFDPSISDEDLKAALDNILSGFIRDEEHRLANKAQDDENAHVDDLKKEFVGSEFEHEEKK